MYALFMGLASVWFLANFLLLFFEEETMGWVDRVVNRVRKFFGLKTHIW